MSYDLRPTQTIQEKNELLLKMNAEKWILFFEHDSKYQACTIRMDGKHYCLDKEIKISG